MPSSKIANYGVDLYRLKVNPGGVVDVNVGTGGQFRVDGNLVVTGSTTVVNTTDLDITDNIITLNSGETGNGVSEGTAGIRIDRGDNTDAYPDVFLLFDETLTSGSGTGTFSQISGSFKLSNEKDELVGLYASSIRTFGNNSLYLLDSSNNGFVVVNSINYAGNLFDYIPGSEPISETNLKSPADDDALINARALIDYVDSYHLYNWQDRITAIYNVADIYKPEDPVTGVVSLIENVRVIVGNTTVARFTNSGAEFPENVIIGNELQSRPDTDLILNPNGIGNVNVSNKRIVNLADPILPTDAVNVQYLESRIGNLSLFDVIDPNTLEDGSMLVYNGTTEKFEGTKVLNDQTIDAGTY